jgi:hypothetical protein
MTRPGRNDGDTARIAPLYRRLERVTAMQAEIATLARRYGRLAPSPTTPTFRFSPLNRNRAAEVAMAIRRPNGLFLLQTRTTTRTTPSRTADGGVARREIEHALLRDARGKPASTSR